MNDELRFLEELPSLEGYTPQDRYRDFRLVFSSEEGRRIMAEILSWGKLLRAPVLGNPIDPFRLAIYEGNRNIARKLLTTYLSEPTEPQDKQKVKP